MKLKNRKAVSKRIRITGRGRVFIRTGGQDHFNSRETGKVRTNKRRDRELSRTTAVHIKRTVPYL